MKLNPASQIYPWLVVGLLWVVGCLNYLDRIMLTTMRESVVAAIPMTEKQFGLLTSVFLWVYGLLSPMAGFLADKFNRVWIIAGSLFIWSAVTWLTGHAVSFEQLLLARALMGVSEACYIPAALSLIADYHLGKTRALANGVHLTGIFIGSALGGVGGWLAEKHDWSYAFRLFGVIGVVYAFVVLWSLRESPREYAESFEREKGSFLQGLRSLLSMGSFYLILIFWGLLGVVGWAIAGWMPTYLAEHFSLGQGEAGLSATGYIQSAALVGVIASGFVSDRLSQKWTRARIWVPTVGMLLAAPALLLISGSDNLNLAIMGLILYGFMRVSADANLMPIVCLVVDSRYRATAYGFLNLAACLVGGIAIYIGGALRDQSWNLSILFQICSFALVVCGVLLMLVKTPFKSSRS